MLMSVYWFYCYCIGDAGVYEIFTMHAVLSSYIYQHFIAFISTPLSMGEIIIENVTGMINSIGYMHMCVFKTDSGR